MDSVSEGTKIATSKKVIYYNMAVLGLLLFSACAMMTIFFGMFSLGTNAGLFIFIMMWVVCFFIWVIGSILAFRRYKSTQYILSKDALAVTKGAMFKSATDLYRYDSIMSVHISQNLAGKTFGYSDLVINIPKLGKDVTLNGVVEPLKQAEIIKKRINDLQPTKMA